jgi:hypothetical protein
MLGIEGAGKPMKPATEDRQQLQAELDEVSQKSPPKSLFLRTLEIIALLLGGIIGSLHGV